MSPGKRPRGSACWHSVPDILCSSDRRPCPIRAPWSIRLSACWPSMATLTALQPWLCRAFGKTNGGCSVSGPSTGTALSSSVRPSANSRPNTGEYGACRSVLNALPGGRKKRPSCWPLWTSAPRPRAAPSDPLYWDALATLVHLYREGSQKDLANRKLSLMRDFLAAHPDPTRAAQLEELRKSVDAPNNKPTWGQPPSAVRRSKAPQP